MTTATENTRPQEAAPGSAAWELTGNHSLAFPLIDRATGAIQRAGVLHRGAAGIVEWIGGDGEPLLCPVLSVDGAPAGLASLSWERLDSWIPRFTAELDDRIRVRGTLCAPPGHEAVLRGAVYLLEIENRGRTQREIEVALRGTWGGTVRRVVSERLWGDRNRVVAVAGGAVLEAPAGQAFTGVGSSG